MTIHSSLLFRDSLRYWASRRWQAFICIVLLAVGSASVAVLWTVTDVVARKPLPFPDSHQLYGLQSVDGRSGRTLNTMSLADFRDFREAQTSFSGVFAYRGQFFNYKGDDDRTRQLVAARVTRDFASTLKLRPEIGSLFKSEDFDSERPSAAIISYDFWQSVFGGSEDAIGKTLWLDDATYQVVGVMPKSFNEPAFADAWLPFPDVTGEYFVRDSRYWQVAARLKPEVPLASAEAEAQEIARQLAASYPATNTNRGIRVESLREMIVGDFAAPLTLIFVAVSLVMFATCLNLANLQLVSGLQRRGEIGTRQAIGESPHQAFAQAMAESAFVCLVGCGLGWGVAHLLIRNIDRLLPEMLLPRLHEISLTSSLGWTILAIALVASVTFGLLPALQAARANVAENLRSGEARHGLSAQSHRGRTALMVAQITIAVVILNVSLVVAREFIELQESDLGFDEESLVMVTVSPQESRMFDLPGLSAYYGQIADWLRERPGTAEVTSISSPPLWGFDLETTFELRGRDLVGERSEAVTACYSSVGNDFVDTMDITVLQGRAFNGFDTRESEPVALVNQAFVEEYLAAGEDPLSQQVIVQPWMEPRFRQVVGVVADFAQGGLTNPTLPQILVPAAQTPWVFTTFVARQSGSGEMGIGALETQIKQAFPDLGITIETMDTLLDRQLSVRSLMSSLLLGCGIVTVMLSLFGIGSQMAFNVSERTREWGIRLALGASIRQLNGLALRNLLTPLSAGFVFGLGLFAAGFRALGPGAAELDALFVMFCVLILAAIAVASLLTAWAVVSRITRSTPADALRAY